MLVSDTLPKEVMPKSTYVVDLEGRRHLSCIRWGRIAKRFALGEAVAILQTMNIDVSSMKMPVKPLLSFPMLQHKH